MTNRPGGDLIHRLRSLCLIPPGIGAFTLSSKVPSLIDKFARANSSSKKTDFATLVDANFSNTRQANSSSRLNSRLCSMVYCKRTLTLTNCEKQYDPAEKPDSIDLHPQKDPHDPPHLFILAVSLMFSLLCGKSPLAAPPAAASPSSTSIMSSSILSRLSSFDRLFFLLDESAATS
jgi:hypothetical protein